MYPPGWSLENVGFGPEASTIAVVVEVPFVGDDVVAGRYWRPSH